MTSDRRDRDGVLTEATAAAVLMRDSSSLRLTRRPCTIREFHGRTLTGKQCWCSTPPRSSSRRHWARPTDGAKDFDLDCDLPGAFPFMNHEYGHRQNGAIGFLVVDP
jgi:hypothetical protein